MEQRYLIDSNVIIDYTALRLPNIASDFVEHIFNNDFLISVVVKIEVLGFTDVAEKMKGMEAFVGTAHLYSVDDAVVSKTIQLRRSYFKIKLRDAIIAATALVHGLVLISRNIADFKNIKELQVVNLWTMV